MTVFSIALCTYNGARFLPAQLESILRQTRLPDELIACDDGSTDGTLELLRDFARQAPFRVELRENRRNLGYVANFAQAVDLCAGNLIALCDQDDSWHPQKLMRLEACLDAHPEFSAVFSDADLVDEGLRGLDIRLSTKVGLTAADRRALQDPRTALGALINKPTVTGAAFAFRATVKTLALPFPQPLPALLVHDGWLACAAAAQGGIGYVDEPLIAYRQHARQQIGTRFADAGSPPAPTLQLRARRDALGTVQDSLRRLEEVLAGRGASPLALVPLREKLAHVEMRCALPDARLRRIAPVLRDAGRGYYSRYAARGLVTALFDLLAA